MQTKTEIEYYNLKTYYIYGIDRKMLKHDIKMKKIRFYSITNFSYDIFVEFNYKDYTWQTTKWFSKTDKYDCKLYFKKLSDVVYNQTKYL